MKIAIPTDDGIMLSASAQNPRGYFVFTVAGGKIIDEELRWNKQSNISHPDKSELNDLTDCSFFIINKTSNILNEFHISESAEVLTSQEEIITNIIMEFLGTTPRRESNFCCMP